jgi:hypothetical protein
MSKTLEKVRKLIALTASSQESEARNAAFQACKLIRENKFHISDEIVPEPPRQRYRHGGYSATDAAPAAKPHYNPATHGFNEPTFNRRQVKTDTRILSDKQFKTAIRMAHAAKAGQPEGIRFFDSQFRLAKHGNGTAKCFCRMYDELVGNR